MISFKYLSAFSKYQFFNNLLILSSTAKNISEIDKGSIEAHITDAQKRMEESKVTDKEKYLLSYKINTLKNLNL